MKPVSSVLALLLAPLLAATTVLAAGDKGGPKPPVVKQNVVVTHHKIRLGKKVLSYTATAGYLQLSDEHGKPEANVFFVSYVKDGVHDLSKRPISFAFNGGPGAASVWLHLGALGPKRVDLGAEGMPSAPPYHVVDNEATWLPFTDLVFIDPVTTGYSRVVKGQDPRQFHGLRNDVRSVAQFIRLYTTRNRRWVSPKFLVGESYGTTRAAALSGYLQDHDGMYLNGIFLISPVLNFETISFASGNDLAYWLYLPSYTATAWYHKKLAPDLMKDLKKAVAESEAFARGEYLSALAKGDQLSKKERNRVAEQLARFTGLPKSFVLACNLRIRNDEFEKELLRSERRTVGRLDSRYTGIDRNAASSSPSYDPTLAALRGPFTAAFDSYVRNDLGYRNDLAYHVLTGRVWPWSFEPYENRYVDVSGTLREAMTKNPHLRVFYADGYFDLATPFLAMDYTVEHMGLDPKLRSHITHDRFHAGHMVYVRTADRDRLEKDAAAFYAKACASGTPKHR